MTTLPYIRDFIFPAAFSFLPVEMNTDRARVLLMAIGLQETRFAYRTQIRGPAKSFWQYEAAGIMGVLTHQASKPIMREVLTKLCYDDSVQVSVEAVEHNDVLACIYARLLLWTDPHPLPDTADLAWDYYLRNWRPGRPRRESWDENYSMAWSME